MFGHQGPAKSKMLEKLLELFSQMPDKEDLKDGGVDEIKEGDAPIKGAEIAMISAHPAGKSGGHPHPSPFNKKGF